MIGVIGTLLSALSVADASSVASLDDVLSCLETNGVLVDRSLAVQRGMEGILKSIDPKACLITNGVETVDDGGITQAVQAVEFWPEDIAYLKICGLVKGSGAELRDRLQSLTRKAGIILDLRAAAGDDLDSVSCLAGLSRFREQDPLFILTDNQGHALSTNRAVAGLTVGPPLMVLIDGDTRRAAEALIALWRGQPGVMLIGTTTHGDPRLRDVVTLPDGRKVALANRRLVPLFSDSYEGRGVPPDVCVAWGQSAANRAVFETNPPRARALSAKSEQDRDLMKRVEDDAVLRRATDILLGLRTLGGYGKP